MFSNDWKDVWSAGIVNHLWQSTLVVFVAWMLTLALRRNQAGIRYFIWMAASLKFLLPFAVLVTIGGWLRPATIPIVQKSRLNDAIVRLQQPIVQPPLAAGSWIVWSPQPASSVQLPHHKPLLSEILFATWLCGVVFLLLRWGRGWWQIRATLRDAFPGSLPIDIPVLLTSRRIEPGVVGLFHPILLLPVEILERFPNDQLRAILAHERCHVRRRDNLTGAIHMLVELLFWFHPAVWWIERRLIAEREAACDEAVLQLGNQPEIYAESILNVCKLYTESPLVCLSGVTGAELKQRLLRIMAKQTASRLDLARKFLLTAVAIAVFSAPVLSGLMRMTQVHAQQENVPELRNQAKPATDVRGIAATWQGTLHTDTDSRFVIKIIKAEDGTLGSTFYNLSGRPAGLPGFSTAFDGSLLKLDFGFATYEGTLSADGSSLTGRWMQGQNAHPLLFLRANPATEWTVPQPPPRPEPMAADANPEFEVSTIKPSAPEEHGPRYMFDRRRFSVVHVTLEQLVQFAYGVQVKQIAGGTGWFQTETYDIAANPGGEGEPSIRQWQTMVRKLMADRFQLKLHEEAREMSVYALTLAKTDPKFKRSQGDPNGQPGLGFGPGNMGATNATMAEVAHALGQGAVDRPVVDRTGLVGRFDLRMRWTPADMPAPAQNADAPPDFFTAMQEQLGLKLVATKAPVDVIVIDHSQRPSAN